MTRNGEVRDIWGSNLQTAVSVCCHLANTNEELGGLFTAIAPFAKLRCLNIGVCRE